MRNHFSDSVAKKNLVSAPNEEADCSSIPGVLEFHYRNHPHLLHHPKAVGRLKRRVTRLRTNGRGQDLRLD